ncbi:hypothetical protein DPMN_160835 [Dreissena polymorpha]|uniref:Uncharacterized protein n=1 Tax=Dreissena polymorpha TaxID=45954 RepID=A0A9D4ENJ1_DREPO|nr:hypothetical protein DPMN_160835 [Dreissena polymorpha]
MENGNKRSRLRSTFGYIASFEYSWSNVFRRAIVQGPTARMWTERVSSWGAEVKVKGWYSLEPRGRHAIRTHWPDLKSNLGGRLNSIMVTSVTRGSPLLSQA